MSTESRHSIDWLTREVLNNAEDVLADLDALESPLKELHHWSRIENQRPSPELHEDMATVLVQIDQALTDCLTLLNAIGDGGQPWAH